MTRVSTWLMAFAFIAVFGCLGVIGAKHYKDTKAIDALWAQKNREFPDNSTIHQLVEPQVLANNEGHILIVGRGGKDIMYCAGVDKCLYAYNVTPTMMTEQVNELFIALNNQTRQRQEAMRQQQMQQNQQTLVAPKGKH